MPPFNYGFTRLSDARLDVLSFSIITGFANNPTYFPAPHPELDAATAAQTAFSDALAVARGGSLVDKALKNQKRDELETALVALGSWGTIKAGGETAPFNAPGIKGRLQSATIYYTIGGGKKTAHVQVMGYD